MPDRQNRAHQLLDGMTFRCKVTDKFEGTSTLHSFRFENGILLTDAFRKWGFERAPYLAVRRQTSIEISCELPSSEDGTLRMSGTVKEDISRPETRFDGIAVFQDTENHVRGSYILTGFAVEGHVRTAA